MILVDTSGLLAALFGDQRRHEECAEALLNADPPRLLSPFVLAELDYLILKLAGIDAELLFLDEIVRGVYEVAPFTAEDVAAAAAIVKKYRPLKLGLADASLVVMAERYTTRDLLTLDERHFRAVKIGGRKRFRLLPSDL